MINSPKKETMLTIKAFPNKGIAPKQFAEFGLELAAFLQPG